MPEYVYLNGKFIRLEEAKISITDYGFLFGYALFETMHAYNGVVFRLRQHIDRILKSAALLNITLDSSLLEYATKETLRVNGFIEARIRLTISAGKGNTVADLSSCETPTVFIAANKYTPYPPEVYKKGFRLKITSIRRNSQSLFQGIKKTDYIENIFARESARRAGYDDALFLNDRGYVAEGSINNIFLVNGDIVKTPGKETGILLGITRNTVLEIANEIGIPVCETDITLEELLEADEIFLTSTLMEIMPVTTIEEKTIGKGKQGNTTRTLIKAYKEIVQHETTVTNHEN